LITHGQGGSAGGDVARTADLIAAQAGGAAQYILALKDEGLNVGVDTFTHDSNTPSLDEVASGEIIIRLDWSDVNTLPTPLIARTTADFLLRYGFAQQEMHLAGPSRGASVVSNLAIELGKRGVDQVTYIDPVPVDIPIPGIDIGDGPMQVADNVVFADNYWRSDNNIASGFDGQHVDGAHEGNLNTTVQQDNDGDPHTGAGAYYIATIDPDAPIVAPARSSWFRGTADAPARDQTGFHFSRISGGARPADGVGASFGGAAHRDTVERSGAQYANIRDLTLIGGASSVSAGRTITVGFRYGDVDSAATVSIFLDRDRNPFNGNTVTRLAKRTFSAVAPSGARLSGSPVEAAPGTYWLYAQIADADGNIHYAYEPRSLKLTSPTSAERFASISNGILTARGDETDDRIYATTNGSIFVITRHTFAQLFSAADVRGVVLDGGDGNDSLVLGVGMIGSQLLGGGGNDTLIGSDGDDTISGGTGRDRMLGGGGDDHIGGAGVNDLLDGGSGADWLWGEAGDDLLFGGNGNDHLFGGSGVDFVHGGPGTDRAGRDPSDHLVSVEQVLA
jgi:Ca2+-binding RTX toxin-like protein